MNEFETCIDEWAGSIQQPQNKGTGPVLSDHDIALVLAIKAYQDHAVVECLAALDKMRR